MVERLDGWQKLLSDYLAERRNMPFEWGKQDCMAFVAKGVEALTGHDFFTEYSDYHDEESAAALLARNRGVAGIIIACLGESSKNILEATRGDVVLVNTPELSGGIVDDSGRHIALVNRQGLIRVPLSAAVRVWGY